MTWQLAIAISVIANVATILVQRHYAKKSSVPATFPSAASYVFGVIPVGLTAGFLIFPHAIHWSWWLALLLVIEGASMALSGWTGFQVAGRLGVAPNQTIGRLTAVTTILLGWTILGESLSLYQFIGGAILLLAALLAIWAPAEATTVTKHKIPRPTLILAVVSAITLGISLVTEKAMLGHMQIGGGFLVGWTSQALAMVLLATKDATKANLRAFLGYEFKWSTLMGVINGFTGVFYVYAIFHSDNISLITALTAIVLPLTVLGAYIFLHEREHTKIMWISLAISCVGVAITSIK
jgi:drug/metabolite transporter (DMT)-like permease